MLKLLSLFSGIGAFEKALTNIGIKYKLIGFSEIDKYAIKSYCAIHEVNKSLNFGDIKNIREGFEISHKLHCTENIKGYDIDLITHGSPCQDFSIAGNQAGGDIGTQTRSSLMWDTVEIIRYIKPKYVIYENVKNLLSKNHRHNFDGYLETLEELGYNNYYQVLNSKDYGIPQNRERVFVVSVRNDIDNKTFEFPEKQELKLILKDMLEDEVDEKYYLSDKILKTILSLGTKKFHCKTDTDLEIARPLLSTMHKIHRVGIDNYVTKRGKLRRLTPKECWRLMGFTDEDIEKCIAVGISNSQLYRQAGNSIVVNVLEGIFRNLLKLKEED